MDIEQDYVEYASQFSLALFAASAAYFLDPSSPVSYLTLLIIPVLFGYTAYTSRDSFSKSALLALIALIFAPLNATMAAVSTFIATGNILVSVFAGGERFRDYYSSTTLPLLLTGAILGTGLFLVASNDPAVAEDVRNRAGGLLGESIESAAEDAQLLERQKKAQKRIIRQTSVATVRATGGHVINETRDDFNRRQQQTLEEAFNSAEGEVPDLIVRKAEERMNQSSVDFSKATKNLVSSSLRGQALLALIPVVTLLLYSLQPLVGFLTAISASVFARMMTAGQE